VIADLVRLSALYLAVYIYVRQTSGKEFAMAIKYLAVVSLALMVLSSVMTPVKQFANDIHLAVAKYTETKEKVDNVIENPLSVGSTAISIIKGSWVMPMKGQISKSFDIAGGGKDHHGLDIAGTLGEPVKSAGKGEVSKVAWDDIYGNMVIVNHGGGVETVYGHLQGLNVKVGYPIVAGTLIGTCGSTGNSTGPHLHFEIRVNGKCVNPQDYVK